jgi:hypothetical protein
MGAIGRDLDRLGRRVLTRLLRNEGEQDAVIELAMVHRMIKRGLILSPLIVFAFVIAGDVAWGVSAAIGIALTLGNLWVAGRIIGGVAENAPQALLPAGMAAFGGGMLILTAIAVGLKRIEYLEFAVTGITLVVLHIVLVSWEAANTFLKLPPKSASDNKELVHGA